jgi:hypothetical protein
MCVEKMLQMGFTLKEIQESLTESRYDEVCATYMLLVRDVKEVCVCLLVGRDITSFWDRLVGQFFIFTFTLFFLPFPSLPSHSSLAFSFFALAPLPSCSL